MTDPLFPEVKINGEIIPAIEIAAETQNHHAPKNKPGLPWRKAVRALIIRKLLLDHAKELGITARPQEFEKGKFENEDDAQIRVLLDQEVQVERPNAKLITQIFEQNAKHYKNVDPSQAKDQISEEYERRLWAKNTHEYVSKLVNNAAIEGIDIHSI